MVDPKKLIADVLRATLPPFDGFEHQIAAAAERITAELGLTREFAACIEDEGKVWLVGDHRYLHHARAQDDADEQPRAAGTFVGTAWTTRWERA
ncbi:hypothetical protein I5J50_gp73 [Mycobacterium phage Purky]|uniref:Uncharacterized protein n=1 Tax=Mycobacterium phage Purky TaxID=2593351 RepID=A0A514TWV5_9CAUD|nr:hypothetical protein I5J50_gp73 [Mycobacterium phage Purky]QDK01176.1 hypothetical protein SEA_PURKY_73 [Mycobacterium phage Purky]